MRYLPLTAADRAEMLARIGVARHRRPVRRRARRQAADGAARPAAHARASSRSSASSARIAAQERRRPRSVPFFVGAGAYRHHVPATRRPPDPALGVPDQLHALPARDRAGHAAIAVRVPDPGRGAHRHGGGQRLDVRRLDRHRRGGADGAPRHQAPQGGALGRPASALRRGGRRRSPRMAERRGRGAGARRRRRPRTSSPRSTTASPASSCRRPTSSATCATSRPIAEKAHAHGALLIAVVTEVVSLGLVEAARRAWAPTSSSARASRSATR